MPYTYIHGTVHYVTWQSEELDRKEPGNVPIYFHLKINQLSHIDVFEKNMYMKKLSILIITSFQQISKSIFTGNQYIAFSTYQLYLILYDLLYRRFMFVWA